ncbi:MAG: 3'-5' exonuclease [Desulfovibrionaceae bacterium]|nr:3'-5' exonuclease [Desulfovibrionaceae bacterium]
MSVFAAIDFETSGRERHSACSVGLVRIEDGVLTGTYCTLIRPPSSRVEFTWVHGLTWSVLKDAPTFPEVWPEMQAFLEGAQGFVAHNAPFDRGVLEACCQAFGCPNPNLPFYCTLKGARAHLNLPSRGLDVVCAHYGIPLRHHDALSDAEGSARIFVRMQREGLAPEAMLLGPKAKPKCAGARTRRPRSTA